MNIFASAYSKSTGANSEVLQKAHEICLHGAFFAPMKHELLRPKRSPKKVNMKCNCRLGQGVSQSRYYEPWIYIETAS